MIRSSSSVLLVTAVCGLTLATGCARRAPIPGRAGYVTLVPQEASGATASHVSGGPSASLPGANAIPQRDANVWRAAAEPWIGTPYRLGGISREGIDCSGFAWVLHSEVSRRKLPRTTTAQWRASVPVNVNQLRPGDLLFFNTTGKGVSHVGVFLEGDHFVHASTSRGVMYSSASEPYWAGSFLGARRP